MSQARRTVVVAPDSFKGSCSAKEAATAIARGLEAFPDLNVVLRPMADGGEGTLEVLTDALGLELRPVDTVDAAGRPRRAVIGLSRDGRVAVVETAQSNGLPHVADLPSDPCGRHTEGVGHLLAAALAFGAQEILVAVGGSSTSDGGAGCLRALGAKFLDAEGRLLSSRADDLARLARVDLSALDPRWRSTNVRVLVDVDNPLLGERGTAAVFAPQKGAGPGEIVAIEAALTRLAEVASGDEGGDHSGFAGAGAAGGLPVGLRAYLGARVESGAELVSEAIGLAEAVSGADLVLSGEGSFDTQSLHGKVVSVVSRAAAGHCPLVVLAGRVNAPAVTYWAAGVTAALSVARGAQTSSEMFAQVHELLEESAAAAASLCLGRPDDVARL